MLLKTFFFLLLEFGRDLKVLIENIKIILKEIHKFLNSKI